MKIESSLDNQWIDFQRLKLADVAEGDITEPGRLGLEPNLVRLLSRGIRTESIAWLSDTLFSVEDIIVGDTIPQSPSIGDKYIVNTPSPNPLWLIPSTDVGDVVEYRNSGWQIFLKVSEKGPGKLAYNNDNNSLYIYKPTGWEIFQPRSGGASNKYIEIVLSSSFIPAGNLFEYVIPFSRHGIATPVITAATLTGQPIEYGYDIDGSFDITIQATITMDSKIIIT